MLTNMTSFSMTPSRLAFRPAAHAVSLAALAAAFVLAGCSSVPLDDGKGAPVENRSTADAGANSGAAGQSSVKPVDLGGNPNDAVPVAERTVYFDFDSYVVKSDGRPIVERFAKTLVAERARHVQVEGYTDDRGGREYNLALGQKRAESVAKSLQLLGANEAQIEAVSYGKERPATTGDDEDARAQNRRAVLSYR